MSKQPVPLFWQVAIAVGAVLIATLVRLLLSPILGGQTPLATYVVAVLLTACFWGWGPAVLCLALASFPAVFLFFPGNSGHGALSASTLLSLGVYYMVGLVGIAVSEFHLRVQRRLEEEIRDRKKAERELRESEEWHRVTLASVGDAVITTDTGGRIQFLNHLAEIFTGWSSGEAVGRLLNDTIRMLDEHSREEIECPAGSELGERSRPGPASHAILVSRDGTERVTDNTAAPIRDQSGQILGAVLVFRDETEKRRAERTLREQEHLLDLAHVLVRDRDRRIVMWNTIDEELYGWTREEALGKHSHELLKTRFPRPHDEIEREFLRTGRWQGEVVHTRRDGTPVVVASQWVAQMNEADELVAVLEVNRDITEKSNAKEALKLSEERYKALTELIPQLVWTSLPDGRIDYASPRWLEYTGFADDQFQGESWSACLHPEDLEPTLQAWYRAVESGTPHQIEHRVRDAKGSYRWFLTRAIPLYDEGRQIVKWYGTCTDIDEQKRARDLLRTEKERLKLAFEAGRMFTLDWEAATGQLVWSETLEQIQGLPRGSFIGTIQSFRDLIHPDDRQAVESTIVRSFERRSEFEVEFRYLLPTAQVHWMSARGQVFCDEAGRPVRVIGVGMDVTERKRSEERIVALQHDLENRIRELETLQDLLPVGVAIAEDPLCRSMRANRSLLELLGSPPGANVSLTADARERPGWRVYRDGRELSALELPLQKCAARGIAVRDEECDLVWSDGRLVHLLISANPLRDDAGELKGCVGVHIDITERRRNEQVSRFLAEVSASLAALSDPANTLKGVARLALPFFADFCFVDLLGNDRRIHRVAACHARPGREDLAAPLAPEGPLTSDPRLLIHRVLQSGRAEIVPEFSEDRAPELANDAEHEQLIRELRPRSIICVPLAARNRTFGAMTFGLSESARTYGTADLALAEDLARRTAIAVENARFYQELKDADRRKTEFLAMLAHELRNPLVPIRNAVHLLSHPARVGSLDSKGLLEMLDRQVETMSRLVDDLMDVTRISRGKVELRKEIVELSRVVDRAVGSARTLIEDRGHALSVQLPPDSLPVPADPMRLEQILCNLLQNAAKYTDPGGRISLVAERSNGEVTIRVRDSGVGIEPEMLPRIFDLFTQIEDRRSRAQGGLGIGLSLVRTLVELHGGSISALSDGPGRGSEFVVRLPVVNPPPASTSTRPAQKLDPANPPSRRVLVVDDNVDAARSLAKVLRLLYGQEVQVAHDGPSALEIAETFRPEIVLLDIGLPGMSGHEVASILRKRPWCEACLMAAVTGWGQDKDREKSRAAGFDLHLVKPVNPETIRDLVAGRLPPTR